MTPQHEPTLEVEEEVLADRVDRLEPPAVQPLGEALDRGARVRRLDLESLADERLEPCRGPSQRIALGHESRVPSEVLAERHDARQSRRVNESIRFAAAGAAAATAWALLEPIDQRLFRYDYSDVAVLGKFVTRGPHWRASGLALHAANGAAFGLAYLMAKRRFGVSAFALAMVEHVSLYPLSTLVDRYHPARGSEGIPKLVDPRAFGQATLRHAVFGALLGRLA